jgi:hypothetical protein
MWMHEDYDSTVITNDVSLLKLDEPLQFNEYVQPLRLAETGEQFPSSELNIVMQRVLTAISYEYFRDQGKSTLRPVYRLALDLREGAVFFVDSML